MVTTQSDKVQHGDMEFRVKMNLCFWIVILFIFSSRGLRLATPLIIDS